MINISVVINTINEEENLPKALSSIRNLADEIVVVDMRSTDRTVAIAKEAGAKVYEHKRTGYVEPARNFAISKAHGKYVLILDADEEIPSSLAKKLKQLSLKNEADYYRIPRKNIIFGKWMKHSGWWPDFNIRFFKKGSVVWNEVIHSVPMTQGKGVDLQAEEKLAIVHNNYKSIEDYLERMNRYTTVQSELKIADGYKFIWKDLIDKSLSEFLSRYFAGEGYKDGLHGLSAALLQSFSEAIMFLKIWQKEKFIEQSITLEEIESQLGKASKQTNWWVLGERLKSENIIKAFFAKIRRRTLKNYE